jgi:hypothetical protein
LKLLIFSSSESESDFKPLRLIPFSVSSH